MKKLSKLFKFQRIFQGIYPLRNLPHSVSMIGKSIEELSTNHIYIYHWGKRTCFNFEIFPTQFSTHSWKKIKSTCQSWRINFSVQNNGWTQNGGGLTQGRKNGSHETLKIFTPQLNEQFHPLVNWATKNKKTVSIIVTGLLTGILLYIMVYYNPLITG